MNSFNFKRRNLVSGPHLLGTLLIFAGLFALVSPVLFENGSSTERFLSVGTGAIILGLVIVSSYSGTLIDPTEKRFKEYISVGGFRFGKWTTLPAVSTVEIVSISYISTNTPNGISPTLSGRVNDYKLLVYSSASNPTFLFTYSNRKKAVKHAKYLASNLDADLVLNIPERE